MDSVELNQNGDCIEDISAEQLLTLDSDVGVFGDPEVLPRVGNQYQVEIPLLIKAPDYLLYTKNPIDAENRAGVPSDFLMGLPIQVMWITKEVEDLKHDTLEVSGDSNDASNKRGPSDFGSVRETPIHLHNEDSKHKVNPFASEDKMHQYRGPGNYIVPGSCGDSWSDTEKASFLLGLYVFEKNFVQVKRFIEGKKMGDILSFYYGKFYRSDEYRRWSACRKMRSRKFVYGQRIFSGFRQQELLSRMLPHVSEECKNALLEVSKTFAEGKISLEEYVSSLKAMVGMNILVGAVGIGKGKQDLTGIAMEPLKSNQVINMRPEIPVGKACSSLTPREIVKFLTGDYRLSKARSNDLFWEAVWPRLLARGWQSEQPKNQSYAIGSKHFLVFLVPGIKKFSRRRLVKGTHYFDSVTDVLSKVASEPGLLELEIEEDEGNKSKEEYGWTNETNLEQDDLPERRRHCYLQPRTPSRNTDFMKFTVVDTSLADGKTFKVRELKTLPVEISKIRSLSEGSDGDKVSTDESDCDYTMLVDQEETNSTKPSRTIADRGMFSSSKELEMNDPDSTNVTLKISKNHKKGCKEKHTTKAVKSHSSRRLKQDDCLAPVAKRRRKLSSCSHTETSNGNVTNVNSSDTLDLTENVRSQVGSSQDNFASTNSSKGSPVASIEGTPNGNYHATDHLQDRRLFDLNLPVLVMELTKGQDGQTSKEPDDPYAPNTSVGMASLEQQPNVNSRRHSTRNRPPTARALEALANGFLTTNRRRKGNEGNTRKNYRSRTKANTPMVKEGGNFVCNGGNSNMFGEFEVLSKGNGTQVSGP